MREVIAHATDTAHISVSEIPAPANLAPWAVALGAEIHRDPVRKAETFTNPDDEPEELATGRLVILYDPSEPEEWAGPLRVVSYIRAEIELDLGHETLMGSVAWSWLTEALEIYEAEAINQGGTTTRVLSESFGTLAQRPSTIDLEMRTSWTPVIDSPDDIADHVEAWLHLLTMASGLPPLPEGVSALPGLRR